MIGSQETDEFHQGHLVARVSDPHCRICLSSRTQSATLDQRKALHLLGVTSGAAYRPSLTAVEASAWAREIRHAGPKRVDIWDQPPATKEVA